MSKAKNIGVCLVVGVLVFAVYVNNFGLWPRYFDIAWDEEVQLHDGSVILINVKQSYQRLGMHLFRYEKTLFRGNEFTFKDPQTQEVISVKSRLGIALIDKVNGDWYILLRRQGPFGEADETPNRWGDDFTQKEERLAKYKQKQFVPVSWDEAPANSLEKVNLFSSGKIDVLATFNGKRMSLQDKAKLRLSDPQGPGAGEISRPLRMKQTQGIQHD
jgi:lipopolysaccharide export LptBFGC system permease protein LptF